MKPPLYRAPRPSLSSFLREEKTSKLEHKPQSQSPSAHSTLVQSTDHTCQAPSRIAVNVRSRRTPCQHQTPVQAHRASASHPQGVSSSPSSAHVPAHAEDHPQAASHKDHGLYAVSIPSSEWGKQEVRWLEIIFTIRTPNPQPFFKFIP